MKKRLFSLHDKLAEDTVVLGRLTISIVLLAKDSRYPWVILVPERASIKEIYELSREDQLRLQLESCAVAKAMSLHFQADKMNVATLGNIVPQLHIHHVARFKEDDAWPDPVWGKHPALHLLGAELSIQVQMFQSLLTAFFEDHGELTFTPSE